MMRLIQLQLVNFKQYRNASIDFRDGLTGIIGANGAGKSTIFDAIRCAFFGAIPFTKEHLRSDDAPPKDTVRVCLIFEAEEIAYRVIREFKGTQLAPSAALYIHEENKLIASQQNPVSQAVSGILGITYDAFLHSVFAGQKELGRISDARGAERRELIRQMIGMSRIDEVQQLVRADMNDLASRMKGLIAAAISDEDAAALETDQKNLDLLIDGKKKELQKNAAELEASAAAYGEAEISFTRQQKLFAEFTAHQNAAEKALHAAQSALKNCNEKTAECSTLKSELPLLEKYGSVSAVRDALMLEIKKHTQDREDHVLQQEKQVRIMQMEKDEAALSTEITVLRGDITACEKAVHPLEEIKARASLKETELKKADELRNNLTAQEGQITARRDDRAHSLAAISSLGAHADCPLCLRPLAGSYDAVIEKLNSEITQLELKELAAILKEKSSAEKNSSLLTAEIRSLRTEIENLSASSVRLEQQKKQLDEKNALLRTKRSDLDTLKKSVKIGATVTYDKNRHEKAAAELETAEKEYALYLALKERTARIPELEMQIKNLTEQEKAYHAEAMKEEQLRSGTGYSPEAHRNAQAARGEAITKRNDMQKKKDILLLQLHEWEKKAERINADITRHKEQAELKKKTAAEKENLARLVALFDGFKNAVLAKVQPSLSAHASALFTHTTGGRYESIMVDENFDFHITDRGQTFPLGRFSGGETDLANLCLRIAVSRTIRELAGSSMTGFLGFDEIFGSQDAERRHMVMEALNRLSEQYQQIFIVSHIEDIRDEFPQLIEVSRSSEGSIMKYRD